MPLRVQAHGLFLAAKKSVEANQQLGLTSSVVVIGGLSIQACNLIRHFYVSNIEIMDSVDVRFGHRYAADPLDVMLWKR